MENELRIREYNWYRTTQIMIKHNNNNLLNLQEIDLLGDAKLAPTQIEGKKQNKESGNRHRR